MIDYAARQMTTYLMGEGKEYPVYKALYEYHLARVLSTLLLLLSLLCISLFLGLPLVNIAVFFVVFRIRRYSGGLHVQTRAGCFALSCMLYILCSFLGGLQQGYGPAIIAFGIATVVLLVLAPVTHRHFEASGACLKRLRKKLLWCIAGAFLAVSGCIAIRLQAPLLFFGVYTYTCIAALVWAAALLKGRGEYR